MKKASLTRFSPWKASTSPTQTLVSSFRRRSRCSLPSPLLQRSRFGRCRKISLSCLLNNGWWGVWKPIAGSTSPRPSPLIPLRFDGAIDIVQIYPPGYLQTGPRCYAPEAKFTAPLAPATSGGSAFCRAARPRPHQDFKGAPLSILLGHEPGGQGPSNQCCHALPLLPYPRASRHRTPIAVFDRLQCFWCHQTFWCFALSRLLLLSRRLISGCVTKR